MIAAIFASTVDGGFGHNGALPWPREKGDLEYFQKMTTGHVVVMGRDTWDGGMPKPLPNRINYVITSRPLGDNTASVISGNDISGQIQGLSVKHPGKTIFIIGGVKLIESLGNIYDVILHTEIKGDWPSDTKINLKSLFDKYQLVDYKEEKNYICHKWLPV